jgi:Family of unknown function (DUF6191)
VGFLDVIDALFAPSRRHQQDERKRLELSREELGLGDPHRGPVDLDSGVVMVRRPPSDDQPTDERPS